MISNQEEFEKKICTGRYLNGQLAVFVHDYCGESIAELSIMQDSVELAPNEFILKEYSENQEITKEFLILERLIPTNRFVLIGPQLCSICQINSEV
ncbi:MAG: hypothetical protein ACFFAO_19725 [Candidatus Hermodarchaeota archaeon]